MVLFGRLAAPERLYGLARSSSLTTHPGFVAAESCAFLAHLVRATDEL